MLPLLRDPRIRCFRSRSRHRHGRCGQPFYRLARRQGKKGVLIHLGQQRKRALELSARQIHQARWQTPRSSHKVDDGPATDSRPRFTFRHPQSPRVSRGHHHNDTRANPLPDGGTRHSESRTLLCLHLRQTCEGWHLGLALRGASSFPKFHSRERTYFLRHSKFFRYKPCRGERRCIQGSQGSGRRRELGPQTGSLPLSSSTRNGHPLRKSAQRRPDKVGQRGQQRHLFSTERITHHKNEPSPERLVSRHSRGLRRQASLRSTCPSDK